MKDSSQKKLREKFIKSGVKMIGPETIFFSKDTKIGKKVTGATKEEFEPINTLSLIFVLFLFTPS